MTLRHPRVMGTIEYYSVERKFGFISGPNKMERQHFFYLSAVQGVPQVGRKVTFEPSETMKGPIALDVVVL